MGDERAVSNEALLKQLKWRYATKKFDAARKISDADWQTLEEVLVLTPSSFGLQPWKFFVVDTPALKEQLVAASWGQSQVKDASHTLVMAIKKDMDAEHIGRYVEHTAATRSMPVVALQKFREVMLKFAARPGFDVNTWAKDQVYIALGNFMTAAAMLGIDTCPMEGLDPKKYDEILGLDKLGFSTVLACPAGYRSIEDKYALTPKVRFHHVDVIAHL